MARQATVCRAFWAGKTGENPCWQKFSPRMDCLRFWQCRNRAAFCVPSLYSSAARPLPVAGAITSPYVCRTDRGLCQNRFWQRTTPVGPLRRHRRYGKAADGCLWGPFWGHEKSPYGCVEAAIGGFPRRDAVLKKSGDQLVMAFPDLL